MNNNARRNDGTGDEQAAGHVLFDALPNLSVPPRSMVLFEPAVYLPEEQAWSVALSSKVSQSLAQAHTLAGGLESLEMLGKIEGLGEEFGLPPGPLQSDYGPVATAEVSDFPEVDCTGLGIIGALPPLPLNLAIKAHPKLCFIPREEDCYALWDRYRMPEHIREHSQQVADLALAIAHAAKEAGMAVDTDLVYAAGLLHDLGKAYCIVHGGNHAQLGAAWVMRETRNGPIARGVLFHVYWPWEDSFADPELFLVMCLIYSDKRVKHNKYVTLKDRLEDLLLRYGRTENAVKHIRMANGQGQRIEAALSDRLGVDLSEYIAHRRRLVKRA